MANRKKAKAVSKPGPARKKKRKQPRPAKKAMTGGKSARAVSPSAKSMRPARPTKEKPPALIRSGAKRAEVFNSGLEVWLYDDASTDAIRSQNVRSKLIDGNATDGQIVGYSLLQDDGICVDVVVGKPLNDGELSVARWLEPQTAFLRLPSGKLVIESNDACRVGEEEPTDKGAIVAVPPGNYRLTLYRIDHEALEREGLEWNGAQELVVLSPGGKPNDDVTGLLPFVERRDLSWVGKIKITGSHAQGLVWFDDFWDTYFANIDARAAKQLGLKPGSYLRTTVPASGLVLVTVFAPSWEEGQKLKPPAGPPLLEFGYGSIIQPQRWTPHEALFCRRVKAAKAVEARHKNLWLEASFEILELESEAPPARLRGPVLLDTGKRGYWRATLAERTYYDGDEITLSIKLDARVEGVTFDEPVALPDAVARIDDALAPMGLEPLGDFSFDIPTREEPREYTVRAYGGAKDCFAAIWASADSFEVFLFSRVNGGKWVLTGTIDEDDAQRISQLRPRLSMVGLEERPLADFAGAHRDHLARVGGTPDAPPADLKAFVRLYDDYLAAAID